MPVINTHQNIAAFLDMLAVSEGTANHPLTKNRGYDVIVTGLDGKPEIFTDYSDHPFAHGRPAKVFNRRGEKSTASGRYQQLYLFWPHYRKQLALPDFSPLSQDRLAIQLIRERGALDDIRAGRIERAISRCRNIWASLPGAGYGQREHSLEKLVTVWRTAGADAGTVPDLPAERGRQFCRHLGDSGDGYLCGCRWCRRVCHGVCTGALRAGAAAGIAGREDCHVAVFAAGAVAQTGGGSGGDGGDVYLAGRCRVDFYRADLSRGVGVLPADT